MTGVLLDSYAPYDSGPGANVMEAGWRSFMNRVRPSGIMDGVANLCNVFANSTGMFVYVDTGEVWLNGQWGLNNAIKSLPIASNSSGNPRFDLVVARNDYVGNNIVFDTIQGTPAASPTVPLPTQNSVMYELAIGYVLVGNGVGTITAGNCFYTPAKSYPYALFQSSSSNRIAIPNTGTSSGSTVQTFDTIVEADALCSSLTSPADHIYFYRSGVWDLKANARIFGTHGGAASEQFPYLAIWKNGGFSAEMAGSNYPVVMGQTNQYTVINCSTTIRVVAGDYVQLRVTNGSVHTWTAYGSGGATQLSCRWLQY